MIDPVFRGAAAVAPGSDEGTGKGIVDRGTQLSSPRHLEFNLAATLSSR